MATTTGKLVMDHMTGEMVDEVKEDQVLLAIFDPEVSKLDQHPFQRIFRSQLTLNMINEVFQCNAAFVKDPFGNVIYPKDWLTKLIPPNAHDKWFYLIHERFEPAPRDDAGDIMYEGQTRIIVSDVPKECQEIDIAMWLLHGIAEDYEPLVRAKREILQVETKLNLLKQKTSVLPALDLHGSPEQQAEVLKTLADVIKKHNHQYDQEINALRKKKNRIEKLLFTEPVRLERLPKNFATPSNVAGAVHEEDKRIEKYSWLADFASSRGAQLAEVAIGKCNWNEICLVPSRPTPRGCRDEDLSAEEMDIAINMRAVRLNRLRHGQGRLVLGSQDPLDEEFHVSSIGSMYSGNWRLGKRHGFGTEYATYGMYEGEFTNDLHLGKAKVVFGQGITYEGTFELPRRLYEHGKWKYSEYAKSLLNGEAYADGVEQGKGVIRFADGAIYEGELDDGRVTGYGKYTSSAGVVEEGYFVQGVLHGKGKRKEPNGFCQEGDFVHGVLEGRGVETSAKGHQYEGFFENGVKSGRGRMKFSHEHALYEGFWHENLIHGYGDFYYCAESAGGATGKSNQKELPDNPKRVQDPDHQDYQAHSHEQGPDPPDHTDHTAGDSAELVQDFIKHYDFWYEGAFCDGHTKTQHRNIDLKHQFAHHLPYTTNGLSKTRMPFLTTELPTTMQKLHERHQKNAKRRQDREWVYRQQQECANLTLYYQLLDAHFEQWASKLLVDRDLASMSQEEIDQFHMQQQAIHEYERKRQQLRKEKYNLSPRQKFLPQFETYLERINLVERVQLDRAARNIEELIL